MEKPFHHPVFAIFILPRYRRNTNAAVVTFFIPLRILFIVSDSNEPLMNFNVRRSSVSYWKLIEIEERGFLRQVRFSLLQPDEIQRNLLNAELTIRLVTILLKLVIRTWSTRRSFETRVLRTLLSDLAMLQ